MLTAIKCRVLADEYMNKVRKLNIYILFNILIEKVQGNKNIYNLDAIQGTRNTDQPVESKSYFDENKSPKQSGKHFSKVKSTR